MLHFSRYVMVDAMNPANHICNTMVLRERLTILLTNVSVSPEGFLAIDGILDLCLNVVDGLVVYPKVIEKRLMSELPFIGNRKYHDGCCKSRWRQTGTS